MNRFNFFVCFISPMMFPMTLYCKCVTYNLYGEKKKTYTLYIVGI